MLTWSNKITSGFGTEKFEQQRQGGRSLLLISKIIFFIAASASSLWVNVKKKLIKINLKR